MTSQTALSSAEEHELVAALAEAALAQAAPEELAIFEETADEYFRDPDAALKAPGREEAVGFGLDLALLTPYLLAVATPVVKKLAALVEEAVGEELKPSIAGLVRRVLHRPAESAPAANGFALTPEQAHRLRETAYERGVGLGLDQSRATLLADSIVGGLALG